VDRSQAYGRQTVYGAAVVFPMLEARMPMPGEVFLGGVATLILL
jgi:hypothetical protein